MGSSEPIFEILTVFQTVCNARGGFLLTSPSVLSTAFLHATILYVAVFSHHLSLIPAPVQNPQMMAISCNCWSILEIVPK